MGNRGNRLSFVLPDALRESSRLRWRHDPDACAAARLQLALLSFEEGIRCTIDWYLSTQDVDALWLDLRKDYRKEIQGWNRFTGVLRLARKLINPFKYPLAAWRFLLNRPVFRNQLHQTPLMATTLYVLEKPAT